MKKSLEKTIKKAFCAPKPVKANSFIFSLTMQRKGRYAFYFEQISYIRRSTVALFLAAASLFILGLNVKAQDNEYWLISIIPFCILPLFLELASSAKFNMLELELSCKYNLQQVILTRFAVLGGAGLLFLMIVAPITAILYSSWILAVGLFIAFFSTSALCILICERGACNELLYVAAAAIVSVFWRVVIKLLQSLTQTEIMLILLTILAVLLIFCAIKAFKFIKSLEELPCLQ